MTEMRRWGLLPLVIGLVMLTMTSCSDEDDELGTHSVIKTTEGEAWRMSNKVDFTKKGDGTITRFQVFLPVPQTNIYQDVDNVTYTEGEVLTDCNYGNQVVYVDRPDFPGSTYSLKTEFHIYTKKVNVDFSKIKTIHPYNPDSEPCKRHLGDRGRFVMTSHPWVISIGDSLWQQSSDVLDYARRCYEYTATHFRYIHGPWRTLDEILKAGGGECGDFSTVVVSLLRYKGIPSRHNNCITLAGGYHVWVDFYLEGYGWIPLDATYKNGVPDGDFFGKYDGQCVVLSQDFYSDFGMEFKLSILQDYWYLYDCDGNYCDMLATHRFRRINAL